MPLQLKNPLAIFDLETTGCNGFQIVALLMRDSGLASMVNLVDAEEPFDLYAEVARDVTKVCMGDWSWGHQ